MERDICPPWSFTDGKTSLEGIEGKRNSTGSEPGLEFRSPDDSPSTTPHCLLLHGMKRDRKWRGSWSWSLRSSSPRVFWIRNCAALICSAHTPNKVPGYLFQRHVQITVCQLGMPWGSDRTQLTPPHPEEEPCAPRPFCCSQASLQLQQKHVETYKGKLWFSKADDAHR